jgi:FixJ family two-component response regulator
LLKVSVSIITSRAEDIRELNDFLHGTPWELIDVSDLEGAAVALKTTAVPILLFDRDTAGSCWQTTMKGLIRKRRGTCVILLSNVTDQYLWDEMVQQGGFDLLTRPFKKEQVLSTLVFAYAHCRVPWPKIAN